MQRIKTMLMPCCVLLLTGCGHFKSPSIVVKSLYQDCNDGEYPKARFLFIKDVRDQFDGALASNGPGVKGMCDRITHSGAVSEVVVTSEVIKGDTAVVTANISFKDNSHTHDDRTELMLENGAWKVSK